MFEDFRKQAEESTFKEPETEEDTLRDDVLDEEPEVHFLGMTASQRFALMALLFVMISILGILFLLITDRVALLAFG
jgi:hypothetical protein